MKSRQIFRDVVRGEASDEMTDRLGLCPVPPCPQVEGPSRNCPQGPGGALEGVEKNAPHLKSEIQMDID